MEIFLIVDNMNFTSKSEIDHVLIVLDCASIFIHQHACLSLVVMILLELKNVKDYIGTLRMSPYKFLCWSGELDNENPYLITSTTG